MSNGVAGANHGVVIGFHGGSNVIGPTRSGTVPWTKPANVTYWTTRTGSLVNTGAWSNNYGIATPMIEHLVNVLGYTGAITLVEHGVAGASIDTCATTFAAQLVTHFGTVGVRPAVVCCYVGSVDAGTPALAAAARANIQTVGQRFRTPYGGGVGLILGGLHTPEGGAVADENAVDAALLDYASDHRLPLSAYFANRDAPIQGGGSSHLSDGIGGGAHLTGIRFANIIHAAGVLG